MKKCIYDERNGLWYEPIGDYYIPVLTLPSEEQRLIGKWGRMHREYLREHQAITDCLVFQNSFRLSARMMLEVMEE